MPEAQTGTDYMARKAVPLRSISSSNPHNPGLMEYKWAFGGEYSTGTL